MLKTLKTFAALSAFAAAFAISAPAEAQSPQYGRAHTEYLPDYSRRNPLAEGHCERRISDGKHLRY